MSIKKKNDGSQATGSGSCRNAQHGFLGYFVYYQTTPDKARKFAISGTRAEDLTFYISIWATVFFLQSQRAYCAFCYFSNNFLLDVMECIIQTILFIRNPLFHAFFRDQI